MTDMFHLLFTLVLSEVAVILILLFGSPLRKLVILVLNQVKKGRGPVVAKTVAATMIVVFSSTLFSITKIQKRKFESGMINPTDEVLMANNLLDACLMGFSLFLALIMDRLHHYIGKLHQLRNNLEAIKNLNHDHHEQDQSKMKATSGVVPAMVTKNL